MEAEKRKRKIILQLPRFGSQIIPRAKCGRTSHSPISPACGCSNSGLGKQWSKTFSESVACKACKGPTSGLVRSNRRQTIRRYSGHPPSTRILAEAGFSPGTCQLIYRRDFLLFDMRCSSHVASGFYRIQKRFRS